MPIPSPPPFRGSLLAAVLLAVLAPAVAAQPGAPVYPDLSGEPLVGALARGFAPAFTFPYDRARDSLFAVVYAEPAPAGGDSLRCLYSGVAVYLAPGLDPTTAAYAASPRVSTEHLWPQNRGSTEGTPAHSDLHHLAPAQQSINASRSDVPFGDVPDAEASRWWGPSPGYLTAPPPLATRDLYSEKRNGSSPLMEPRESVEGDVARALFYVWTVYGPHGGPRAQPAIDAAFWTGMLPTLLQWDSDDPADAAERARSVTIAGWQGTQNPFVLDASLAARAFSTATPAEAPAAALPSLTLSASAPNPSFGGGTVRATLMLARPARVAVTVLDALGRTVAIAFDGLAASSAVVAVDAARLAPGVYTLRAVVLDETAETASRRFVVVR